MAKIQQWKYSSEKSWRKISKRMTMIQLDEQHKKKDELSLYGCTMKTRNWINWWVTVANPLRQMVQDDDKIWFMYSEMWRLDLDIVPTACLMSKIIMNNWLRNDDNNTSPMSSSGEVGRMKTYMQNTWTSRTQHITVNQGANYMERTKQLETQLNF